MMACYEQTAKAHVCRNDNTREKVAVLGTARCFKCSATLRSPAGPLRSQQRCSRPTLYHLDSDQPWRIHVCMRSIECWKEGV
jgi:hypothetical protein